MKFVEMQTLYYNSEKNAYLTAGMVVLNVDEISKVTHYDFKDRLGDKHSLKDIWLKNGTYQDTIKISLSTWDDLKKILKADAL